MQQRPLVVPFEYCVQEKTIQEHLHELPLPTMLPAHPFNNNPTLKQHCVTFQDDPYIH